MWVMSLFSMVLILHSCYWSRQINLNLSEYDPIQVLDELILNGTSSQLCINQSYAFCPSEGHIKPVYSQIILCFLDAVGYRYLQPRMQDTHPIFQKLQAFQQNNVFQFLTKSQNIPPSTDYTINGLLNGVQQKLNYVDSIFKYKPDRREDSLLKRLHDYDYKSLLFSAKKMDWFKMASGVFDRVENSREFEVDEPTSADISTYEVYKAKRHSQYVFVVLHFMGFDALGHALGYQNYDSGLQIMEYFQEVTEEIVNGIHSDQLLIGMGDHDQSYRGKHYHCSSESNECEGFLFVYTPNKRPQNISKSFKPVDYSATLHGLLGLPTSFQCIGKVLPELYPISEFNTLEKLNSYIRILIDLTLSLYNLEKNINYMQTQYYHSDQEYLVEVSRRIKDYNLNASLILNDLIGLMQSIKSNQEEEKEQQDTGINEIIERATQQMHDYTFIAEKIGENYMFSKPSQLVAASGLLLGLTCLVMYQWYMRAKLRSYFGGQMSKIFTLLFFVTQLQSSLIVGYMLTLTQIKIRRLEVMQFVALVLPLLIVQIDNHLELFDFLLPYLSFIAFFFVKVYILHSNIIQWNGRGIVLIMVVFISQLLTQIFYSIDKYEFIQRKLIVYIEIVMFVVFIYVNPKLFKELQRGKTKLLYLVIFFMFADLCVIFQFNQLKGWFTFSLIFLLIFQDGQYQDQYYLILLKLLTVCLIIENIHPVMVPHSQYDVLTLEINSMIIIVDDFKIIPSLISMFLGAFGPDIITCFLVYFIIREYEVDYESCLASFILPTKVIIILRKLYQIFNFQHSFNTPPSEWSMLVSSLYSLHVVLLQLLIMQTFCFILLWRRSPRKKP